MAGKGGGAWKVAYADFVTAMMAFFLVMWITSQNESVKEAVAHHFRHPYRALPNSDPLPVPYRQQHSTGRWLGWSSVKPVPNAEIEVQESRKPYSVMLHTGGRSLLGVVVLFPEASDQLDERAQEALRQFVPILAGKPQRIEIRGHASRRPLPADSTFHDAWQLSYARCLATMEFLHRHGIAPARFRLSQSGTFEPYGEGSIANMNADSRVEVFMLSELAEQPARAPRPGAVEPRQADNDPHDRHLADQQPSEHGSDSHHSAPSGPAADVTH
jgi:chemotaxis protein MotB